MRGTLYHEGSACTWQECILLKTWPSSCCGLNNLLVEISVMENLCLNWYMYYCERESGNNLDTISCQNISIF